MSHVERPGTEVGLTRGAYFVLGMIAAGHRTGYEISKMAELTSRLFWVAGDGQVYPQLRKLAIAGLVEGAREAQGARAKTVYRLTDLGCEALDDWLTSDEMPMWELRDEGLLKLFFCDALSVEELRELIRILRRTHERAVERLREIQPVAATRPAALLTQRHGLRMHQTAIDWCDELAAQLRGAEPASPAAATLEAILTAPAAAR